MYRVSRWLAGQPNKKRVSGERRERERTIMIMWKFTTAEHFTRLNQTFKFFSVFTFLLAY